MREVDKAMVLRLVAENAKQRFELFYGYDPSPPPPKKGKKGQGGGGGGGGGGKKRQPGKIAKAKEGSSAPAPAPGPVAIDVVDQTGQAVDAAQVEDLAHEVAKSSLAEGSLPSAPPSESTEMPLVSLPVPDGDGVGNVAGGEGEYFIRATQGHSLNLDSVAHLEEVKDDPEGRAKTGEMVHGTKWELWETLSTSTPDTETSPVPLHPVHRPTDLIAVILLRAANANV
jgi:2'-phosphotransferase